MRSAHAPDRRYHVLTKTNCDLTAPERRNSGDGTRSALAESVGAEVLGGRDDVIHSQQALAGGCALGRQK